MQNMGQQLAWVTENGRDQNENLERNCLKVGLSYFCS